MATIDATRAKVITDVAAIDILTTLVAASNVVCAFGTTRANRACALYPFSIVVIECHSERSFGIGYFTALLTFRIAITITSATDQQPAFQADDETVPFLVCFTDDQVIALNRMETLLQPGVSATHAEVKFAREDIE
jgi:hypothetical protein